LLVIPSTLTASLEEIKEEVKSNNSLTPKGSLNPMNTETNLNSELIISIDAKSVKL